MATFSMTNRPKVRNPYEAAPASPPAGAPIGPSQGVVTPPPTTRPQQTAPVKFAPVRPQFQVRPHTGFPTNPVVPNPAIPNPYQPPVNPPRLPPQTPPTVPAVTPPPAVPPPPSQPSFTTVANPTGGLSGYGQGGVWAGGNTTATTGGLLPTGGTTPATQPHGSDYAPRSQHKSIRDQFAAGGVTRGGMAIQNPYLGETDQATQGVLKQLQAGGVNPENLPSPKVIYEMMNNSGLTADQVLKHFQAVYGRYKNDGGYEAAMAGHGANFRNNYDVNQKIKAGQYGSTGWLAGDTGSVSDARKNAINQMRARQGQGAVGANWGAGTDPKTWGQQTRGGDELIENPGKGEKDPGFETDDGGSPPPSPPPNTDMGGIGAHGANPATGGGAYGPLGGGHTTSPGGQRHELPGLGGGGTATPEPGGGTVPNPRPKPPKGGYVDPNMIGRIFNGLASLFQ